MATSRAADDARLGYFGQQFDDQTSLDRVPWNDVINRWHLVKKNPDAAISDPVEPITWWIENTTPHEIRDIIKEATLRWNVAFESGRFQQRLLKSRCSPKRADWDAGDNPLQCTAMDVLPAATFRRLRSEFQPIRVPDRFWAPISCWNTASLRGAVANEKAPGRRCQLLFEYGHYPRGRP